jgi:hypothetical protein
MYRIVKQKVVQGVLNSLVRSPWYTAYLIAATKKYIESPLYRNRMIEFGEEFAKNSFITNLRSELPFFKWKVRKDKRMLVRIALLPYSITLN